MKTVLHFLALLAFSIAEITFTIPSNLKDDGFLNTVQLANKYGYSCEEHFATTDDGYILGLHRITGRLDGPKVQNSAPTVLIIHGIYSASSLFILTGTNSLGGILSDNGLDVWLGNIRGNRYSRNHTTLDPNKSEFWKHTYNEMALKDYPTMIDYILNVVGKSSLHFVGYSQGGMLSALLLGLKPEYNAKIKSISLIGSAYVGKKNFESIKSKIFKTAILGNYPNSFNFKIVSHPIETLPYLEKNVKISYELCNGNAPTNTVCHMMMDDFLGKDENRITQEEFTYLCAHLYNGQSSNIMLHLSQVLKTGVGSLFDYRSRNLKFYNQTTAPVVDLAKITPPKLIIYGTNDHFFSEYEATTTANVYTNARVIRLEGFNHGNFMLAKDMKEKLADPVTQHIQSNN